MSWEILDPALEYWASHGKPDPYESGRLGAGVGRSRCCSRDGPGMAGRPDDRRPAGHHDQRHQQEDRSACAKRAARSRWAGCSPWSSRPTARPCSRIPSRRPTPPAASIPCRVIVVVAGRPRCRRAAARRADPRRRRRGRRRGRRAASCHGPLAEHASSVVMPFLLPDTPVVAWWPDVAPDDSGQDPLGQLAIRRITDATYGADPLACDQEPAGGLHLGRHRSGVEPHHLLARAADLGAGSGAARADHVGGGVRARRTNRHSTSWRVGWPAGSTVPVQRAVGELKVELVRCSETITLQQAAGRRHRHDQPAPPSRTP